MFPWCCPNCSRENLDSETFCSSCGTNREGLRTYDLRSRYPADLVNGLYGKGKNMEQKQQSAFVVGNQVGMDGLVAVVDEGQVELYSARGYRLVEIIYSDYMEYAVETTSDNENGYNNSYGNKTHTVQKPMALRKAKFVMVQSGDQSIAEKQEEINGLRDDVRQNRKASEEAVKKSTDFEKKVAALESDKRRLDEAIRGKTEELAEFRKSYRKLEGDLGKVRNAVGDLKMKEIIGA